MSKRLEGLRVCYFGHYRPGGQPNRVFVKALVRSGAHVIQFSDERGYRQRTLALARQALQTDFDLLLVGFPGHSDMPLARLIATAKRVPLVFDAHVSLYDSAVFTRCTAARDSFGAHRYFALDKLSCLLADQVWLDTERHADFFVHTFGIPRERFRWIYVGADDEVYHPLDGVPQHPDFTVFWAGSFFSLHGVEHILEAAAILRGQGEAPRFTLFGNGPQLEEMRQMARVKGLENVEFPGQVPFEDLPRHAWQSHLTLGVFGDTPQTRRVIPNKVFDGLAMARPVITADVPAIRDALRDREEIWLVPLADPPALAEAILTLRHETMLRESIGRAGYDAFRRDFSIEAISERLSAVLGDVMDMRRGTG